MQMYSVATRPTLLSAEAKNEWNYTASLPYAFMAWCLIKLRDNFVYATSVQ
jgi:hypothetical protein